jgi:anti-anti-sigma factor
MNQQAYQIERDRRVLVARPSQVECSGKDIAELAVALCRKIDSGEADSVVIDLCNVHHMDSCCLSRLLSLRQHTVSAGGSVALARCQTNVQFLFEMTRLDRAFGLYETAEIAIAELRERRTRPKSAASPLGDAPQPHGPLRRRSFAPLLSALLHAHQRRHASVQPTQADQPLPGFHR